MPISFEKQIKVFSIYHFNTTVSCVTYLLRLFEQANIYVMYLRNISARELNLLEYFRNQTNFTGIIVHLIAPYIILIA